MRWAPQVADRIKPLRLVGPHGLQDLLQTINDANNYRFFNQRFSVDMTEIKPGEQFEFVPGLLAQTMKTPHTKESLALRLTHSGGKRFVYTSDTGFTEELGVFGKQADMLLMECSFRRNKPLQTHLELSEAMGLAKECDPAKLVLTHLYPEWDAFDLVAESSKLWKGEVIEAKDGLVVRI